MAFISSEYPGILSVNSLAKVKCERKSDKNVSLLKESNTVPQGCQ